MTNLNNRQEVVLHGTSLKAALELITMKQSYASKREDIFARYEAEMAAFAAEHSDRVKRLFALVHRGSHTRQSDGWLIDGTSESVRLVPILPEPIAAAMLEQRAIGQSTH